MSLLQGALRRLIADNILWSSEDKTQLGLQELRDMEESIAYHLHRIAQGQSQQAKDAESEIAMIEQRQGRSFTEEQMNAGRGVLGHNVNIITGYAGTGTLSPSSGIITLAKSM